MHIKTKSSFLAIILLAMFFASQPASVMAQRGGGTHWANYLQRINTQPFQVYGWEGTQEQLAHALGRVNITHVDDRGQGEHFEVSNHGGALQAMAHTVWAGMRLGFAPRVGIDGSGDPGPLSRHTLESYRHFFLALVALTKVPPRPPADPGDPLPDWTLNRWDITVLEGAPDGGGFPDDGDGVGPGDRMCKYLVCEPPVCGQPPFPPEGELIDCKDLQDEYDRLKEKYDYWAGQVDIFDQAVKSIDLTIKGKATAESGAQVAQMITALGMILAPEPASTGAGVALAGKVVTEFTLGQIIDALGLCWGSDCGLQAALAAAQSKLADARNKARAYKAGMDDVGQQLAACLQDAAAENPPLQAAIDAYNEARAAYDACVASQVCEWRSRPCR